MSVSGPGIQARPTETAKRLLPWLVSYAVGALLGVALLALLPEALTLMTPARVFALFPALAERRRNRFGDESRVARRDRVAGVAAADIVVVVVEDDVRLHGVAWRPTTRRRRTDGADRRRR